ncbi:hypothetical protein ACEOWJ_002043 [Bacillus cereus]
MKKVLSNCSVLMIMTIAFLFGATSEAFAGTTWNFKTEDKNYDGEIKVTTDRWANDTHDVIVKVYDLERVNWNSGSATYMGTNASALQVRLCNKKSLRCTGFTPFYGGNATFEAVLVGDYWVDIRDTWSNYYFRGFSETDQLD